MDVDLVVIGAGPAGMAAARRSADFGLDVVVLDEQRHAGGQIYRDVAAAAPVRGHIIGKDYSEGLPLVSGLDHPRITHVNDAKVWAIESGRSVSYTSGGVASSVEASHVLLCTGALERAMPINGWTLPGVMTAGAGQILLKQSGLLATEAVLIGSGPLLYLIGAQMARAGTPPLAMIETQRFGDFVASLRHLLGAIRGWRYLMKGLLLLNDLRRAGVPRFRGATDISIEGGGRAEAVNFTCGRKRHRIACETVFLHHGVVPNTQAARSMDIEHAWSNDQRCFVPRRDDDGRTDIPSVFIAGDGAGIGGAKAAAIAGRIAASRIATDLGKLSEDECRSFIWKEARKLRRELAARPFIDRAYPAFSEAIQPRDDTIVCRCEEVTAGDVRRYASLGCLGPNQTKAFGRCGMGPCQGRYCGLAVTEILAETNGLPQQDVGHYRIRSPIKPITLAELAGAGNQSMKEDV